MRCLGYLKYTKGRFALAMIATAAMAGGELFLPWVVKIVFDSLTGGQSARFMTSIVLLAVVAAGTGLCDGVKGYSFTLVAEQILLELRSQLYRRLHGFPLSYFQSAHTGNVMSVLMFDAPTMSTLYKPVMGDAFTSLLQLGAAVVILAVVFGWLALLAPLACVLYVLIPIVATARLRALNQKGQSVNADLSGVLQESISAMREIKAFHRSDWDIRRIIKHCATCLSAKRLIGLVQMFSSLHNIIFWGITVFFYWYGGRKVLAHEMSIGSLFAMVWYFSFLNGPVRHLITLNGQFHSALAASDNVFALLDSPMEDPSLVLSNGKDLSRIQGHVEFDNVAFSYGGDKPVFSGVSFSARAGERIGIVGPSGVGKSTLVSLLVRLNHAESGRILIDGEDISQISLKSLQTQIACVFQDTFLFNTSIRENIRFARLNATDSEVAAAAKAANAHDFIMLLPRGYDTEVGERGAAVSGGQRQRIAIARAILLDPRILILDEATSSLDRQAETAVSEALERLMRGRTTFIIAHQFSRIAGADRIIVFDQGGNVHIGNHVELMNNSTWYRQTVI